MSGNLTVVYQGLRYELHANYDVNFVAGAVVEAMNRAALGAGNRDARPTNLNNLFGREDHGTSFYPWLIFHLADGSDLWITVNEALHIGIERPGHAQYFVDGDTEFPDPLFETSRVVGAGQEFQHDAEPSDG